MGGVSSMVRHHGAPSPTSTGNRHPHPKFSANEPGYSCSLVLHTYTACVAHFLFLFKFVLKIFYGTIVVENTDLIPKTGQPCIVCANHSNSLTDALVLVTSIPSSTRNMLRLTAKSTQFGRKTFTSWLIESAGTVPIRRRKDFNNEDVDNSEVMEHLMQDNPELLAPVNFDRIRELTTRMQDRISSGTIDAPSWDLVRCARLASRIYAPLGTRMSLGDYVRLTCAFVEALKPSEPPRTIGAATDVSESVEEDADIQRLRHDLKIYQDQLVRWGIKDDRIRRPLSRRTILFRICIRFTWSLLLFTISIPGLILWTPVFTTTFYAVRNFKKSGPIWDTWDEIAQYKLVYGLFSGVLVWITAMVLTLPVAPITAVIVPLLMWMTLRWLEDAVSAFRAFVALTRLLMVGKVTLKAMRQIRGDLHARIRNLAVGKLGLPMEPEKYFLEKGGREKGRVRGNLESGAKYFSVRRRRKRDWNETLRLYDKVDYPDDGL
ncbi:hypothetical protein ID866_5456 [Astraeus odoratus]|nr:hypothetical protein ID866_5456 [Astraeus odoratus]